MSRRKRGFTLIELLIVVAIIAILAAIAVPNFLEAQTRAKVTRVKADFRALATAIESYAVDYGTYMPGSAGLNVGNPLPPLPPNNAIANQGFSMLVSPISYITTIPLEPFGYIQVGNQIRMPLYECQTGKVGVGSAGRNRGSLAAIMPANIFMLESVGPDKIDDTSNIASPNPWGSLGTAGGTGEFPMRAWRGQEGGTPALIIGIVYDPTNGTLSSGQVWRSGGSAGDTATLQTFRGATESN
jgi:type II secretion system protein G